MNLCTRQYKTRECSEPPWPTDEEHLSSQRLSGLEITCSLRSLAKSRCVQLSAVFKLKICKRNTGSFLGSTQFSLYSQHIFDGFTWHVNPDNCNSSSSLPWTCSLAVVILVNHVMTRFCISDLQNIVNRHLHLHLRNVQNMFK